jgi:hypothetical protein
VVGKLGEGGMGVVYEARDRQRDMRVAVKTLRKLDAPSLYRFKREFRAISDLSHPNIVSLYELVSEGDDWFLTMELVHGVDFISYVTAPTRRIDTDSTLTPPFDLSTDGPTQVVEPEIGSDDLDSVTTDAIATRGDGRPQVADIVDIDRLREALGQLARALNALHAAGMVHRDVKPSNVRITPQGRVVLMDFGIVADRQDEHDARPSSIALGTPSYMAPEQAAGGAPTTAADWYAFGVMMYHALTGSLPFRGRRKEILIAKQKYDPKPPGAIVRGVPADLENLCMRLLSRRAKRRPREREVLSVFGVGRDDESQSDVFGSSVFVGRDRELEALRDAYSGTCAGTRCAVFIEGESGMGKTTLVRHFLDEITSRKSGQTRIEPIVLRGQCHERESLAYKAFDAVVDNLSRALMDLPNEMISKCLPDDVDLLTRLFPVLRQVKGIRAARALSDVNPHELRQRAFDSMRALLANLCKHRPVVIAIDNVQWADRDSMDLLLALTREPAPHRLMFIGAARTEDIERATLLTDTIDTLKSRQQCFQLFVGPLSEEDQRSLIDHLTSGSTDSDGTLDSMSAEAGGSPLLLVELVRYVAESREDDSQPGVRATIEDVLHRRIRRLPDTAQRLLETISVADEALPLWLLRTASGLEADEGERARAALRAAHLTRVERPGPENWIVAYHDRIREAVYAHLDDERRREINERIAHTLEGWKDATVELLARHWRAAGDREQGRRYLVSAADAAAEKLAFDHAAELYEAALDLEDDLEMSGVEGRMYTRSDLYRRLGDSLELAGRLYEAAQAYESAAAETVGDAVLELERLAADNLMRSGHIDKGVERLAQVLRELGVGYAPTRRRAALTLIGLRVRLAVRGRKWTPRPRSQIDKRDLARLDVLYAAAGSLGMIDHVHGAAIQTRHLLDALRVGDEWHVCRALGLECAFLAAPGGRTARRAEVLSREVLLQARRIGDPYLTGIAQLSIGGGAFFTGRVRQAATAMEECERLMTGTKISSQWEKVTARYFLALAQIAVGDYAGVADTTERSLDEAERSKDIYARTMFVCIPHTITQLRADNTEIADAQLDTALEGWPTHTAYVGNYVQAYSRALVRIYAGDGEAALDLLDDMMPAFRELMLHKMRWVRAEVDVLVGRAALLAGNRSRARDAIRRLERTDIEYMVGIAATMNREVRVGGGGTPGGGSALSPRGAHLRPRR